ncbi:F-box/kelch-repeat protein At2g43270-like [Lolium perenne]|uniref:F-box/kelch-repeat protein At2g43270-like n=1 Tax=Lolium perenne TaxID=4522 RepID=UPI0021F50C84|nr:F-box/kelch-repeat protein At2g43270-like [Lolium perenne]
MAPYLPPELVWEIMVRLPVKSLLRFRCISKAWRDRISADAEFRRANLRAQTPCLLTWSGTEDDRNNMVTTVDVSLYVPEDGAEYTMELPVQEQPHRFAHCDGLVLMPTETVVRVLNPATRRVLTLPWSPNGVAPEFRFHAFHTHQVFGIGHDTRSDTYKVARFFFTSLDLLPTDAYRYNYGVEVFTIGVDRRWHETAVKPPYPAHIGRTATFFKGSLFWTIDEEKLTREIPNSAGESAPGFLRFRLDDESFSVTPPPPCCRGLRYTTSHMAELRGELSVAHAGPKYESIEIWMCNDVDTNPNQPRWNRRYTFDTVCLLTHPFFEAIMYYRCQYLLVQQVLKDIVGIDNHFALNAYTYAGRNQYGWVIRYTPSLGLD